MDRNEESLIRVAAETPVPNLAKSINHKLDNHEYVVLRAIGAGAVNQALKGAIVANEALVKKGHIGYIIPRYKKIEGGITSVELKVVLKEL